MATSALASVDMAIAKRQRPNAAFREHDWNEIILAGSGTLAGAYIYMYMYATEISMWERWKS